MDETRFRSLERFRVLHARNLLPVVLLIASLFVTHNLWNIARQTAAHELQSEFDFRVLESNTRVEERMQTYEQVLRGAAGFFSGSANVSSREFSAYVNELKLAENYPGIESMGLAVFVPAARKDQYLSDLQADGFPKHEIKPWGKRDVYAPIAYIEPPRDANLKARGFDMYAVPQLQAAMEQARDSGATTITKKLGMPEEDDAEQDVRLMMYLAVYKEGAPRAAPEERRASLHGWVFSSFRMGDLMRALLGRHAGILDIEVYDDDAISPATRMFDADSNVSATDPDNMLARLDRIKVGNRNWLVATAALPPFGRHLHTDRPALILKGGIAISLLLSLLAWVILDDRARAIDAADHAMRLALYDALTGLPNRKLITERINQALARARRDKIRVALLFIDLDKFKPVNDEFGHAVGDLLLKEVAKRLQKCMRSSDTAARLGGDEFVALLQDVDGKAGAGVAAEKILHALTQPFEISGHALHIAGSIGVAIYPDHGGDQVSLTRSADAAMYAAKNSGRSTIRFA